MSKVATVFRYAIVLVTGVVIGQSIDRDDMLSQLASSKRLIWSDSTSQQSAPISSPGVTLARFNRLQEGMTYDEVVAVLGSRGVLIGSSDIAGVKTVSYQWEGNGTPGANMSAMFQNGQLITKAQAGLK
jgi:hypothetical protein